MLRLAVLLLLLALAGAAAQSTSNRTIVGKLPTLKNATTATNGSPAAAADPHAGHDMAAMAAGGGHSSSSGSGMMPATKALPVPDACVTQPTAANCSGYKYPHANAVNDLSRLCGAMSFMTACSVARACEEAGAGPDSPTGDGAKNVSSNNPDVCRVFNHVKTICKLDTGMGRMGGCQNFQSMCETGSPCGTQCPEQCKLPGLTAIPTTTAVNTQVRAICDAKPTMTGCAECAPSWAAGKKWADCDLLSVYSQLCGADPSMPQCVEYHTMCRGDGSLSFCSKYNDGAKKVADSVLKNKAADPESKQSADKPAAAGKSAGATSSASLVLVALSVGAAACVLGV